MHTQIILFYFLVNTFIAGWISSEELRGKKDKTQAILTTLIIFWMMVFAIPTFIASILWTEVIRPIYVFFQLDFWYRYFFTKQLYNLKEEELAQMNAGTIMYRSENTIANRIYKYCTELVNKRNNYIHNEQSSK